MKGLKALCKYMKACMLLDAHDVAHPCPKMCYCHVLHLKLDGWTYLILSVCLGDGCINGCLPLTVLPANVVFIFVFIFCSRIVFTCLHMACSTKNSLWTTGWNPSRSNS